MNIAIWTTGDKHHGMGHVARQTVLAKALLSRGHSVTFLTQVNTPGEKSLASSFGADSIITYKGDYPPPKLFRKLLPDIAILDVEHGPSRATLVDCKAYSKHTVVVGGVGFYISDQDSIDDLVDLQIYQSPDVNKNFTRKTVGTHVVGLEYLIIDEAFINARAARQLQIVGRSHILVSMGGADPRNLTHHVARALADAFPAQQVLAIYGPASQHAERRGFPNNVSIIESPPPEQFAHLMSDASVIITALGMTVYEALCVGVPVACTAWSSDHELTARYLESKNAIAYLGKWDEFDSGSMFAFAHNVMSLDAYRKSRMEAGWRLVDGLGEERVVRELEKLAI